MLYIVGMGPGSKEGMTLQAEEAINKSDLIVGFSTYTKILKKYFPDKKTVSTGMRKERERVAAALEEAETKTVSLICSGDPELYGMAGLALEMSADRPNADIEIIPGVTAAMSGGAVLGAPLTSDFAVISLSDILTPREKIRMRLEFAAKCDLVIVLYNPSSRARSGYLKSACELIMQYRDPETVCGYVKNIGRDGQESRVLTLSKLSGVQADMFTTVFIGNSETLNIGGKMVTPRGYNNV